MSNDRFDVLDRLAPLFEAPEPSFEAFLRRRDRKRRNQRIAAGVVGIAVFVAAVWIVTSGRVVRSDPDAGRSRTGGDRTDRLLRTRGLAPSQRCRAEHAGGGRGGLADGGDPPWHYIQVYSDGRVIWSRQTGFTGNSRTASTTGWLERRLTPEGVDLVRSGAMRLADLDAPSHVPASVWEDPGNQAVRPIAVRGLRCVVSRDDAPPAATDPGSAPRPHGRASSPNRRDLFFLAPREARGGVSGDDDRGGSRSRQDLPRGWVRTKRNCLGALLRHQGPECFSIRVIPLLPDGEVQPVLPRVSAGEFDRPLTETPRSVPHSRKRSWGRDPSSPNPPLRTGNRRRAASRRSRALN